MRRFLLTSTVLLTMLYGTACLERIKKPSASSSESTPEVEPAAEAAQEATLHRLETENQSQRLRLLEKDAAIARLEQQLASRQQTLDDAIQEVVRAKAKHSNPQDRARAASESAEAEIALESLRGEVAGAANPALAQAERLMVMSAEEFDKRNFGGALFVTRQAKQRIRAGMDGLVASEPQERLDGEHLLALPLALTLTKNSNLRQGPGQEFKVLEILSKGAAVTGYSSNGPWLRVKCADGTGGWIHQSLLR